MADGRDKKVAGMWTLMKTTVGDVTTATPLAGRFRRAPIYSLHILLVAPFVSGHLVESRPSSRDLIVDRLPRLMNLFSQRRPDDAGDAGRRC